MTGFRFGWMRIRYLISWSRREKGALHEEGTGNEHSCLISKPYDHSIIQGGAVALDLCDSPF